MIGGIAGNGADDLGIAQEKPAEAAESLAGNCGMAKTSVCRLNLAIQQAGSRLDAAG
jgi:hypothetical protein